MARQDLQKLSKAQIVIRMGRSSAAGVFSRKMEVNSDQIKITRAVGLGVNSRRKSSSCKDRVADLNKRETLKDPHLDRETHLDPSCYASQFSLKRPKVRKTSNKVAQIVMQNRRH